jgi:hypothetical protein
LKKIPFAFSYNFKSKAGDVLLGDIGNSGKVEKQGKWQSLCGGGERRAEQHRQDLDRGDDRLFPE